MSRDNWCNECGSRLDSSSASVPKPDSQLRQRLDLFVDRRLEIPGQTSDTNRALSTYLSDDVERVFDQIHALLSCRYGRGYSKSIVVDLALRIILVDVQQNGEDSSLIQWLERHASRKRK